MESECDYSMIAKKCFDF